MTKLCKPDAPMRAGNIATCTILVDNLGPSDARDVVLTDTHVSDGTFTIVERDREPGRRLPERVGVVTCNLGTEPAGGRTTIVVTGDGRPRRRTSTTAPSVAATRRIPTARTTSRATASASSPSPT